MNAGAGTIVYVVNPNGSFLLVGKIPDDNVNYSGTSKITLSWPLISGGYYFYGSDSGGEARAFDRYLDNQFD